MEHRPGRYRGHSAQSPRQPEPLPGAAAIPASSQAALPICSPGKGSHLLWLEAQLKNHNQNVSE